MRVVWYLLPFLEQLRLFLFLMRYERSESRIVSEFFSLFYEGGQGERSSHAMRASNGERSELVARCFPIWECFVEISNFLLVPALAGTVGEGGTHFALGQCVLSDTLAACGP